MILLKGASAQAHYYGIDRLMKGIKEYSGDLKIALHLYGKNLDYEKVMVEELKIQQSVCFHGFVLPEQLPEIISDIHLGISLLAVHRKGLSSTTTIKSREYCSRGLPFIYAHHDPDFSDREECGLFALRLPATDEPLDFQSIIKWYKVSESLEGLTETMHEYAIQYLDDRVKMKKLLDCIYQQND